MSSLTIVNGRGVEVPAVVLHFASGAFRLAARALVEASEHDLPKRVEGLDAEGRIVLRYLPDAEAGGWSFGLTLCCNAADKGTDSGVVCRSCYDDWDTGAYDPEVVDRFLRWEASA